MTSCISSLYNNKTSNYVSTLNKSNIGIMTPIINSKNQNNSISINDLDKSTDFNNHVNIKNYNIKKCYIKLVRISNQNNHISNKFISIKNSFDHYHNEKCSLNTIRKLAKSNHEFSLLKLHNIRECYVKLLSIYDKTSSVKPLQTNIYAEYIKSNCHEKTTLYDDKNKPSFDQVRYI